VCEQSPFQQALCMYVWFTSRWFVDEGWVRTSLWAARCGGRVGKTVKTVNCFSSGRQSRVSELWWRQCRKWDGYQLTYRHLTAVQCEIAIMLVDWLYSYNPACCYSFNHQMMVWLKMYFRLKVAFSPVTTKRTYLVAYIYDNPGDPIADMLRPFSVFFVCTCIAAPSSPLHISEIIGQSYLTHNFSLVVLTYWICWSCILEICHLLLCPTRLKTALSCRYFICWTCDRSTSAASVDGLWCYSVAKTLTTYHNWIMYTHRLGFCLTGKTMCMDIIVAMFGRPLCHSNSIKAVM